MSRLAVIGTKPKIFINKNLLNDDWAIMIHNQTLDKLADRGGLSHKEIVMNVERIPMSGFNSIDIYYALNLVEKLAIKSEYINNLNPRAIRSA